MRCKLTYIASLLAAGVTATAIIAAPIASAASNRSSVAGNGGRTNRQAPGNVQIDDSPGPAQAYPYGGEAFLLGGGGFGGFGGGFHGGGYGGGAHGGQR